MLVALRLVLFLPSVRHGRRGNHRLVGRDGESSEGEKSGDFFQRENLEKGGVSVVRGNWGRQREREGGYMRYGKKLLISVQGHF